MIDIFSKYLRKYLSYVTPRYGFKRHIKRGVCEATINNWKHDHDGFLESLQKGKDLADAEIASSLYQRAKSYTCKETKAFCFEGCIITEDVDKNYPPDTAAAFIWLKNRQGKLWQDKQEIKHEIQEKTDFDKLCEIADKEGLKVEDYCRREGININDFR